MVFISQEAMSSLSYVDKLVNGLNKNSDGIIKFGMVDLLHNKEIIPETSEAEIAELKLRLIKYDNYSNQKISTNNYLMLIKIFNPFMRCFCYIPKKTVYKYESLPNKSLFFAVCLVIIFYFGLWGLYKYTSVKFSLRWKLSLIFLYANGLPLLGLGFIGYDYLQQNKSIQLQEVYENISLLINDFDSKFGLIKKDYTDKLNCIINEINSNYSNKNLKKTLYEKLKKEVADSGYSDFFVGSIDGKSVITGDGSKSDGFFFDVFASILKFASNKVYTSIKAFEKDEKDINFSSMYDKDIVFFHTIISKIGLISLERLLDSFYYYYFNFVGNTKERDFREIVVVRWSVSQLQENYVKGYLKKLNTNTQNIKCFAFSESNGTIFPEDKLENKELITRFGQILNLNSLSFEEVIIDNRAYAGFGSVGVELDKIAVIGLYPVDLINAKINNIRIKLIWFAIASLLLTLSICRFLSIYFLLPIKDLQSGIEAMKRQDFSYRLPIKTGDEFGELNTVFNNAFESLEELAVATTVQENLFPLKPLLQNDCYVYGKSVTMTRLGGDYFDYFPIGENGIGVLMGDVAGHGIPAGFLMAMAKASVLLSGEEKKQPSKLLASIHKVFHHVKSKKIIRMMTCVYFSINTLTGEYKVVNAGHCYPVVVTKTRKAEFIELDGSPLGITKRPRYVDYDGVLENDSFLLLYTDGILEARNEFGEQMGPTRFLELVNNNYADEPEEYYKNIFAEYKAWSPLADDDITMVLVKIKLNKEIKS